MHTVLVTGVGAIIGYGLVRSARKCSPQVRIVGIDIYEDAVGQHWCDSFERSVPTAAPEFPPFLLDLVTRHSIDLVLPGIEQDVNRLTEDSILFQDLSARVVLNAPELVRVGADKWLTHLRLSDAGIATIKTRCDGSFAEVCRDLGIPFLLKARRSYASKGIHEIHDEHDWNYWRNKTSEDFVYQQIVGDVGSEYTVGLFGYGDGTCSHILMLQRQLSVDGSTAKARVVQEPQLEGLVRELVDVFSPLGPTNLQFRRHDGEFLLLEINPRFSSSHSLRTRFGINDVQLCNEYFLSGRMPAECAVRSGRAVRFIEDLVTYDCSDF